MGVSMLVINRILSSFISILIISQLFDPRGKSKRTNQIMFGLFCLEAVLVAICCMDGSSRLLSTVEVIVLASLFFSFYPLFYVNLKSWCQVYFFLTNVTISISVLSACIAGAITESASERTIVYGLVRLVLFGVWGIAILIWGRELYEAVCQSVYRRPLGIINLVLSIFLIPTYVYLLCAVLIKNNSSSERLLLTAFLISVFILICYLLYFILKESVVKQEKNEHDHNENLLRMATAGLEKRIEVVEEYVEKLRVVNHDRRHFNAMLLELLNQGEVDRARELLEQEAYRVPKPICKWCENETVNVAIGHYLSMAQEKGISLISRIEIPKDFEYDTIGFSMMLGNLIENAIQACQQIESGEKIIWIKVLYQGQFLIEIENTFEKDVELDKEGYPVAKRRGHGFGTRSVDAFIKENQGEILYSIKDKRFSVRIILP